MKALWGLTLLLIVGCSAKAPPPPPPPTLYTVTATWNAVVPDGNQESFTLVNRTNGAVIVTGLPIGQTSYTFTVTDLSIVGQTVGVAVVDLLPTGTFTGEYDTATVTQK